MASGRERDVYSCTHPDNRMPLAILDRCAACPPDPRDPIACSECPWIDPTTGADRPEPLPIVYPPSESEPAVVTHQLVRFTTPPMNRAKIHIERGSGIPAHRADAPISRAIISIAAGRRCCGEQAITRDNQAAYAERIGAKFICQTYPTKELGYGPAAKWEAAEIAADYDAALYLDTDCVVMPRCPNIFDFVPPDHWGLVDERPHLGPNHVRDGLAAVEAIARELRVPDPPHLFNSGVMVMPRRAKEIYAEHELAGGHWTREQGALSVRLWAGQALYRSIDSRFNCLMPFVRDFDPARAWILHRAGQHHGERALDLRRDVAIAGKAPGSRLQAPGDVVRTTRCVVDVAFGELLYSEAITIEENHRRYAARCGADYVRIRDLQTELPYGCSAKLSILPLLEQYDQTLVLDCDVVVTDLAPDIFAEVPPGCWGAVDEMGCVQNRPEWMQGMADRIADQTGQSRMRLPWMLNSGVVVCPRSGGPFLEPPPQLLPADWTIDQAWLSFQLARYDQPLVRLDRRFNWTIWMADSERGKSHAFMWHQSDSDRPSRWQRIAAIVREHGIK
jgi:hypothetical protein